MGPGEPSGKADVIMKMDSSDFSKMFAGELRGGRQHPGSVYRMTCTTRVLCVLGKLKPTMAFMSGKLRIKGDMTMAIKLEKLMGRMNKAKL